jgi:hypothetical protein
MTTRRKRTPGIPIDGESWERIRRACPSPDTWSIALVEMTVQRTSSIEGPAPLFRDVRVWWAYAEPGRADVPDDIERSSRRINVQVEIDDPKNRYALRDRCLRLLGEALEQMFR